MRFLQLPTEIQTELVQAYKVFVHGNLTLLEGNKRPFCLLRIEGHPAETRGGEKVRARQMMQQGLASPLASAVRQAEG